MELHLSAGEAPTATTAPPSFSAIRRYLPSTIHIDTITFDAERFKNDVQLQVQLTNPNDAPLSMEIAIDAPTVAAPNVAIEALRANLFLTTDNGETIEFKQPSTLSFDRLQSGKTTIGQSQATLSGRIKSDPSLPSWAQAESMIQLQSGTMEHGPVSLSPVTFAIQAQLYRTPLQIEASIASNNLTFKRQDTEVTLQTFQSQIEGNAKSLQLEFSFKPEMVAGLIQGDILHNLQTGAGSAKITTPQPLDLQTTTSSLTKLLSRYNRELQIQSGLVTTMSTGFWTNNGLQELQSLVTVRDGGGSFQKTAFSGLLLQQHLQLYPEVKTVSPGYLSVDAITGAIPLKNFSIRNEFLPQKDSFLPQLLIESIQTELFGGIMRSKDLLIAPQAPKLESQIVLNRIDLEELLKLIKVKGLNVSGIVDGQITLRVDNNTITVPEGHLQSRPPGGTIAYFPPGGKESFSTIPAYALLALEEFNYKTLTATPRYMPDGMLLVAIHTEGVSPPLETTREVHLNIDTEQNLLSLLQSLRYSSSLTEEVEKNLQNSRP